MGLLLSILVFSVGVMEVIACARHIQNGYLPEWTPRRHVVAGTSGLTRLREHWRKKPSGSVEYGSKSNQSSIDANRPCETECCLTSRDECCAYTSSLNESERKLPSDTSDNFNSCFQGDNGESKCNKGRCVHDSDAQHHDSDVTQQRRDDVLKTSFSPLLGSTTNEYNAKTHADIVLPGTHLSSAAVPNQANYSPKAHEDAQDLPYEKKSSSNEAPADTPQEVDQSTGTKVKPRPLIIQNVDIDDNESTDEQKLSSDTLTPHSRPSSPISSPRRSKADINWPLFAPHSPISRRPSTPTTAEEMSSAGDISPYFGGEMLTSDHVRSTQRPLSVSVDTYHTDQDITPVFLREIISAEDIKSVHRPLMISTRFDDCTPALSKDDVIDSQVDSVLSSTKNAEGSSEHTPSPLHIHDNKVVERSTDGPLVQVAPNEISIDDGVMSPTEEADAQEACFRQKRRTSKTEYLPNDERVVEVLRKEGTAQPLYAVQNAEPNLIKAAKAASFEEARLECFKTKPIVVETVTTNDARRSSLLTNIENLDMVGLSITDKTDLDTSSALVGRIEIKPTKDTQPFPSNSKRDLKSTPHEIKINKQIENIQGVKNLEVLNGTSENKGIFGAPKSQEKSSSQLDRNQCENGIVEDTPPLLKITTDVSDRRSVVEVTAISVVDEIINDAILRLGQIQSGEPATTKKCPENSLSNEKDLMPQEKRIKQWLEESVVPLTTSVESSRTKEVDGDKSTLIKDQCAEKDTTNIFDSNSISSCHHTQNSVLSTLPTSEIPAIDTLSTLTTKTNESSTMVGSASAAAQQDSTLKVEPIATILSPISKKTASTSEKSDLNDTSLSTVAENENIIAKEKDEVEKEAHKESNKVVHLDEKLVERKSDTNGTGYQPSTNNLGASDEISENHNLNKTDASNYQESHSEGRLVPAKTQSTKLQEAEVTSNVNLDSTKSTRETPSSVSKVSTLQQQQNETFKTATKDVLPPKQNLEQLKPTKDNVPLDYNINDVSNSYAIKNVESTKETLDTGNTSKSSKDEKVESTISTNVKETNTPGDTNCVRTDDGNERPLDEADSSVSDSSSSHRQQKPPGPEAFWLIFSGEYTKAMSKDWHSGHFCCWQCDESLTGQRYVLRDDHPYCIKCYESVFANMCEECNKTIGIDSKDLSYKDKHWHEACFLCTKCRVSLVDKQFGSKADKIYCGNCYDAQFASRCDGCGEIFRAGTKKMEYKTRQWHEKCFCCCVCKSAIGTKSFIPREQEIYCATCYEEKFATRCVKCNKIITSGGVTYKNEPWHRECFTCTNCNTSLAGQRFTSRDEKPYCAECFGELFAKRCTACSKPITGIGGTRFISFEDRHWHNDCFICATCKTSLVGRGFITDADDIICPECAKQKLSA